MNLDQTLNNSLCKMYSNGMYDSGYFLNILLYLLLKIALNYYYIRTHISENINRVALAKSIENGKS